MGTESKTAQETRWGGVELRTSCVVLPLLSSYLLTCIFSLLSLCLSVSLSLSLSHFSLPSLLSGTLSALSLSLYVSLSLTLSLLVSLRPLLSLCSQSTFSLLSLSLSLKLCSASLSSSHSFPFVRSLSLFLCSLLFLLTPLYTLCPCLPHHLSLSLSPFSLSLSLYNVEILHSFCGYLRFVSPKGRGPRGGYGPGQGSRYCNLSKRDFLILKL